jgi:alpha-mannosidase
MRRRFTIAATLLALGSPRLAAGQDVERHYIANDDHTDYFWSGDAAQYRRAFLDTLDYYMDQAESTADRPVDGRSRYNVDGSLWIWEYEHTRPPAEFARLIDHVRAGNISVPFQSLVLLLGAMPTEAVLRDMYYAGSLERRFGLDLDLVVNMENQTLPAGLASLWAGAGAKYSWRGVCACATNVPLPELIDRPREIYRYTGLDGASVVLKWNSMLGDNRGLGGYAEARDPAAIVDYMSRDGLFHARWPWNIYAAFGYGWDDLETRTTAFVDTAAALSRPDRRVIVSNEVDFFRDFEEAHGDALEHFGGAFGNEWDLYVASMQSVAAPFRRAISKLRTAEALAAVVLSTDPAAIDPRDAARAQAFMNLGLFYEHDWVANGEVPRERRVQFQRDTLAQVQGYVNGLQDDALAALGRQVRSEAGAPPRYAVFNALGFARTGPVDLPHAGQGPFSVFDVSTGAEVASQAVEGGLRVLAADVPAVGYRVFEVRRGAGEAFGSAAVAGADTLDNGVLSLRLRGDGALDQVTDLTTGRPLVRAGGAWNLQGPGPAAPAGAVRVVESGPVSVSLEVDVASAPRHRTRVTLYRGLDRVEIRNVIDENFSETVGYGFDFALQDQVMHHEEVGAVLRVGRQRDGGDYVDTGTRTDFLTLNHFVDLSQAGLGVTLSSRDSQFFRAGQSDVATLDTRTPSVFAVVGMQVDGRHLGIPDQGYDTRFVADFSLRAHTGYDAAEALRFGLEDHTPLVATQVSGDAGATLPADQWGLLHVETPAAVLFALKPAETGIADGVTARIWHLGEAEGRVSLRPDAWALAAARRVSHVEVDAEAAPILGGALVDTLPRQALRSYRLTFGDGAPPPPPADAAVPTPDDARRPGMDAVVSGDDARPLPESDARPLPESDARPLPESDARPLPESDARPLPESDARPSPENDARPLPESDARPAATSDATSSGARNDGGGSAGCGCRATGDTPVAWPAALLALPLLRRRRSGRRCSAR